MHRGERPPVCTALRMVSINGAHRNPDIRSRWITTAILAGAGKFRAAAPEYLAAASGDPQQVALAALIERSTNTGAGAL